MSAATFGRAAAHKFALDAQATGAQALFEADVFPRGPNGQDTAGPQGGARGSDAGFAVETGIGRSGEGVRAVVDVKQDGVEAVGAGGERDAHIRRFYLDAGVAERVPRQFAQGAAIPFDDGRDKLGDDDDCGGRQGVEGRAQGKAHAESADEHLGPRQRGSVRATEQSQGVFGVVHTARHQALAIGLNDVFTVAAAER